MNPEQFEKLALDVSKHFATPDALLAAKDLTREQKLKLLQQWEYDLQLQQVATEENMTGNAAPGDNAEKIREVHEAAEKLGAPVDSEKGGGAKTGATIKQ
jgi:hypothetical protein